ncbi:MAG: hypothetical protein EU539_07665 [Promethearchaeota archaeon]|nr:MAG: hypothetical protein EU539_07665 [Candidatus Lokiarchaeota archaeon]
MDFVQGIEGDYLESKNDNLIFDVKGLLHPKERKICFIRFYPHPDGDRSRDGLKYKKIYDLQARYSFLRKNFPKYLFFSNERDLELQGVRIEDIKEIYTPRDYFKKLQTKHDLSNIENYSKDLCNLFINECDISDTSIGISGSPMVHLNKEDSDIDLIIYGTDTSLKFQEKLVKLFNTSVNLRKYNLEEFKNHFNWRAGGSNITFKEFLRSERRKLHQGKYHDHDFFIRYIKSPEDWNHDFYDLIYENFGRVKIKAKISDSRESIFTPCSYKVESVKVLDSSKIKRTHDKVNLLEINSYRGRYCEQATKGEAVSVAGKLERVQVKNNDPYFRILLENPKMDYMVILDP